MNPVDELINAVNKLTELAESASSPPWSVEVTNKKADESYIETRGGKGYPEGRSCGCCSYGNIRIATAKWIVALSPAIAKPLARMLEDSIDSEGVVDPDALAIARQINSSPRGGLGASG